MPKRTVKAFPIEKWPLTYGYHHVLLQGAKVWNEWRKGFPDGHIFRLDDLREYNLRGADLKGVDLQGSDIRGVDLQGAELQGAALRGANFAGANLSKVDLNNLDLTGVDFTGATLKGANLTGANLMYSRLVETNLQNAVLSECQVYGISVWDVELTGADQTNLIITRPDEPTITLDNLEIAQFIYLLLNNERIRDVINTITTKVVLILGRFTRTRKAVLNSIRAELRHHNYVPVLFDFVKPANRDTVETISTLAHMARFVIADLTDAKSVLQELQRIIPNLPSVPVQPLLRASDYEPGMLDHFRNYRVFLDLYRYRSTKDLIQHLEDRIIIPAEYLAKDLTGL